MNYIWPAMIIISVVFSAINGNLNETVSAAFSGAEAAVTVTVSMAGVFCFWSGILKISEKSGFSEILARLIAPMLKIIFPKLTKEDKAYGFITMNVVSNLMGLGNAATPAGIEAMCELERINPDKERASDEMCLLVVMNTASLQFIPTTVIALREAAGSVNAAAILIPTWIASGVSFVAAVLAMKLLLKRRG